jgi:hypothetical protein
MRNLYLTILISIIILLWIIYLMDNLFNANIFNKNNNKNAEAFTPKIY